MQPTAKGVLVIGVAVGLCLLTLLFICIRSLVRIRLLAGLKYDDYLLWIAMALQFAYTGVTIRATSYGLGRHKGDITKEELLRLWPYIFAQPVLLTFMIFVSKAALVAFLLQLVVEKAHKIILWTNIGILGILSALRFIGLFVQCVPVQANINPSLEKSCHFDVIMVGFILLGYGNFLDFFLAALPWFFFSSLRISRKERIVVCTSLSTGLIAGICGIVRFIELYKLQKTPNSFFNPAASVRTTIWTITENCTSIICVCLTVTRTLYRRYRASLVIRFAVATREPSFYPDSSQNRTLTQSMSQTRGSLAEDPDPGA